MDANVMKRKIMKMFNEGHDLLFKKVHKSKLIYNACWEDPRIDRKLLSLDMHSRMVVITSAGCNVLDYLLDSPSKINAVDLNPRQNALLKLKIAFYKKGEYGDFSKMFGEGRHKKFDKVYKNIRHDLDKMSAEFWDNKISYFSPDGLKKTFYHRGTAGTAAWLFMFCLFKAGKGVRNLVMDLFESESLEAQGAIYNELEIELWNVFLSNLVKQPLLMAMLGVPRPQIKLILDGHPGGLEGYIKDKMRHVLTEVPIWDNYFWRVYVHGAYSEKCRPLYLKEENFSFYKDAVEKINVHTTSISKFLRKNPSVYTHYVLLDHQDWMAYHEPDALNEEWNLIFKNSLPGTKVLFRSASSNADFIPESARKLLRFRPDLTEPLHKHDRVGTYGSLHLAEVL